MMLKAVMIQHSVDACETDSSMRRRDKICRKVEQEAFTDP